ncbi:uncharacterized protein LOC113212096 [Frankliniella occidentalis]|uniref:Uncharacterized protein LOC113212096 n=1 Tax=Frankliniella occidentalis TaxID=133901 RepID=A0A6J1SZU7_FRAOC|nr:uncharacterized protein LOC113212096 [Frankliniella occidentalis]
MIRDQTYRNEHYRTLKYVSKIMAIIFLLWFAITFLARVRGSDDRIGGSNLQPQLVILPEVRNSDNMLHKRVSDSLNLTCRINLRPNAIGSNEFSISWMRPLNENAKNESPKTSLSENSMSLYIPYLLESHSGEYKCEAREISKKTTGIVLQTSVQVFILKNYNCSQKMFECPSKPAGPSHCIFKRYVCDGKQDCANGEDESAHLANCDPVDPCKDKLLCDDGRCIPHSWCCPTNSKLDCNITYPYKECCKRMNDTLYPFDHLPNLKGLMEDADPPTLSHMGFLQTTIFTVIGCAMAFMVIVTILVIAICRVHMKRSLMAGATISPGAHLSGARPGMGRIPQQMYDVDLFFGHTRPGLLVTYNINNGVQFVGRPVDPPPYSEVVSTPPREGPPPPYVSHENLSRTVATEDLSRITAVEDDSEDNVAHESDALLSEIPPATPVYSPPSVARDEPVTMASCSTQTGNPETRRSMRSLLAVPVTVDAGTQVTCVSEGYASPSVSVERLDRPSIGMIPPALRDAAVGRLRESFIGLRERGKEEPMIASVSKQSCSVESRPSRSGSRDRSET